MSEPLVSVIMPVFNAERYLRKTIESLLAQTYKNIEIIIIDDGSTDTSADIIDSYHSRIRTARHPNQGQGIARNQGAKMATGSLFSFIDSDDLWDDKKLESQVSLLQRFPEAVATYCDYRTINESGETIQSTAALGTPRPSGNILQQTLFGNCVGSPSVVLVRRSAFEGCGGFNEYPSRAAEDYGLWLALAVIGPVIYNPDTLVSYRRHSAQTTQDPRFIYNRAVGNLKSFERIEKEIETIRNGDTRRLFHDRKWKALLTLGWAARNYGIRNIALSSYMRAWKNRPWRLDIAIHLLRTLMPTHLQ
jgi:glycosyltransferase involved in cell wall biosynthesis